MQGAGPRAVYGELLRQQALVESERALKFPEAGFGIALEAAAPHFLLWRVAHFTSGVAWVTTGSAKRLMKPSASLGL